MKVALAASGFRTESRGLHPDGGRRPIQALEDLGVRRSSVWEQMIPWKPAARLVDRKVRLSDYPVGTRYDDTSPDLARRVT